MASERRYVQSRWQIVILVWACSWAGVAALDCGGSSSSCSSTQSPPSAVLCYQNGASIASAAPLDLPWRCGVTPSPPSTCNTNYGATWNAPSNSQSGGLNPVLRINCPGTYLSSIGAWDQAQPGSVVQSWVDETNTGYISVNDVASGSTLQVYAACR